MLPAVRAARDAWLWAVIVFSVAYSLPVWPMLGSLSDEGVIVHGAAQILDGKAPYRDFFEILAPGSFLVLAGWLKLFGATFGSLRTLLIVILTLIAALTYLAARAVSGRSLIAAALALGWIVRSPYETNHHLLTTAVSMACALALIRAAAGSRSPLPWAAAGLFAGTAVTITQSRGALLACAVIATAVAGSERIRPLVMAVIGMAVLPIAAMTYLAAVGALGPAIRDAVMFPLQHYSGIQSVPFGAFASAADTGIVAFFPVTLIVAIAAGGLGLWRTLPVRAPVLLAAAGFLGAYVRPDTPHLSFAMPLAAPLLALGLRSLLDGVGPRTRLVLSAVLIGAWLWHIAYAVSVRVELALAPRERIETPRGVVQNFAGLWTRDFAWLVGGIQRHTAPRDRFFFYPYMPMAPFLTARRHVARLDVILPGYTTPEQYRQVCEAMVAEADWVVIDRQWTDPDSLRFLYPAMTDPMPPERRIFEAVLFHGFERVADSPHFEVRRRTAAAVSSLCAAIGNAGRAAAGSASAVAEDVRPLASPITERFFGVIVARWWGKCGHAIDRCRRNVA